MIFQRAPAAAPLSRLFPRGRHSCKYPVYYERSIAPKLAPQKFSKPAYVAARECVAAEIAVLTSSLGSTLPKGVAHTAPKETCWRTLKENMIGVLRSSTQRRKSRRTLLDSGALATEFGDEIESRSGSYASPSFLDTPNAQNRSPWPSGSAE